MNIHYINMRALANCMLSVMVVDDDPAILEVTQLVLERSHEISVKPVGPSREALEVLQKSNFDVIVLDYDLPGDQRYRIFKDHMGEKRRNTGNYFHRYWPGTYCDRRTQQWCKLLLKKRRKYGDALCSVAADDMTRSRSAVRGKSEGPVPEDCF